jgi:hypothetical protein
MKLRMTRLALLVVLFAGAAFAHGNKVHVRGIVEKISADFVLVKTQNGKTVEVKLVASTIYVSRSNNADKPAKMADLAAGDLVVIHANSKGNILEAEEVKFSARSAAKIAAPVSPKPKS